MRILIADDESLSRRLLQATLKKWGYEVVETRDGDEAWAALSKPDAPKMVILDWMMPGLSGPEICRKLRETPHTQSTYALLLTAKGGKEALVEGLQAGADDYIPKPFDRAELKARVHVGARMIQIQRELDERMEELEEANLKLQALSSRDGLTGIPNRRHFDKEIEREWNRAIRDRKPLALIMIDIDFFKKYNDGVGHLGGDECLKKVSGALGEIAKRGGDMVARYGGEEFSALLSNSDLKGASILAERMLKGVSDLAIAHPNSEVAGHVTISLGIASHRPERDSFFKALIADADKALYEAKNAGRNCYRPLV